MASFHAHGLVLLAAFRFEHNDCKFGRLWKGSASKMRKRVFRLWIVRFAEQAAARWVRDAEFRSRERPSIRFSDSKFHTTSAVHSMQQAGNEGIAMFPMANSECPAF